MSFSDLAELAGALRRSPVTVAAGASRVVRASSQELRDEARSLISGQITGKYLPHYAASITAEMQGPLSAEVGPDSGHPQGGMGAAIEFGSAKHGPLPHMMPAADKIEPKFHEDIATETVKALL